MLAKGRLFRLWGLVPRGPGRGVHEKGGPPTGDPEPGDGPRVTAWLLLPFGGCGGVRSHPTGPAAASLSPGDEHRRNTVGLTAKANSGLSSRPTTLEGSRPGGLHEVVIVWVH
jgi:hypothetical protein